MMVRTELTYRCERWRALFIRIIETAIRYIE